MTEKLLTFKQTKIIQAPSKTKELSYNFHGLQVGAFFNLYNSSYLG